MTLGQLFDQGIWQMPALPLLFFAMGTFSAAVSYILSQYSNINVYSKMTISIFNVVAFCNLAFASASLLVHLGD